jgi:hypothetical protein
LAIWGATRSIAGDPRVRPTGVGLRLTGAKSLGPRKNPCVLENISGFKAIGVLSASEGGDSPVA